MRRKPFSATKKLLQQRRKAMRINEISSVLLMLMGNKHSVLAVTLQNGNWTQTVGCDTAVPRYTLAGLGYQLLHCHPQKDPHQNGSRASLWLRGRYTACLSPAIKCGCTRTELAISHRQLIPILPPDLSSITLSRI